MSRSSRAYTESRSHGLRQKHVGLHRLTSLWTPSSGASKVGPVSAETVQESVEVHKGL